VYGYTDAAQHPGFSVAGSVTALYVLQFNHDVLLLRSLCRV
jgi:hypothetical protein